jgi:hypothetical protein
LYTGFDQAVDHHHCCKCNMLIKWLFATKRHFSVHVITFFGTRDVAPSHWCDDITFWLHSSVSSKDEPLLLFKHRQLHTQFSSSPILYLPSILHLYHVSILCSFCCRPCCPQYCRCIHRCVASSLPHGLTST